MNGKPKLRLDWASHKSAKHACENWHYTESMPAGGRINVGVWEDERFVGVVIFGMGSGNATNGIRYGLKRSHEMAELCRVALRKHNAPVSRIVKIAVQLLRKKCPKIRMLISMADPVQGHHGGIYQAGNWIFTGETAKDYEYQLPDGRFVHHRTATMKLKSVAGRNKRPLPGKYRYLMPLDAEMRERIEPLRKPYPKRDKQAMAAPTAQRRGSADRHAPNKTEADTKEAA
jgi:hypothetical protein